MTVTRRSYMVTDKDGMLVASEDRLNDFAVEGAANGLAWTQGAAPFTVYASNGDGLHGVYGRIGETDVARFVDTGHTIDLSLAPDMGRLNGVNG